MTSLQQADGISGSAAGWPSTDHCRLIEAGSNGFVVPDAHLLFNGKFRALGPDLMIEKGGACVLVRDYFASTPQPLFSGDGALLEYDTARALAGLGSPWDVAQAGGGIGGAAEIGTVRTLVGGASVTRGGSTTLLAIGNPIFQGDVVETSAGASVGIIFRDNTVLSLGGGARMVMTSLVYDAAGSNNAMVLNAVQGAFSFLAGQVAKTGSMTVATPVATMGIRGTLPIVRLSAVDGSGEFALAVDPPAAGGGVGSYTLTSPTGGYPTVTLSSTDIVIRIASAAGPVDQRPKSAAELAADNLLAGAVGQLYNLIQQQPAPQPQQQPGTPGRQGGVDPLPGDETVPGQLGDTLRSLAAGLDDFGRGGQTTLLGDLSFAQFTELLGQTNFELLQPLSNTILALQGRGAVSIGGQEFRILPPPQVLGPGLSIDLNGPGPGTGFSNTFIEDGPSVFVTGGVSLSLPNSVSTIQLILQGDTQTRFDGLIVGGTLFTGPGSGTLANGIAYTVGLGSLIITFTQGTSDGSASAFEAALQSVQFVNSSQNPDATIRVIDVVVTLADGRTASAQATIAVVPVNDAPVALPGVLTVSEDGSGNGQLVATDVDSTNLTFAVTTQPQHGVLTLDPATGAFSYTPNPNFTGTDSFTFTASDGTATSAPQTITITVEGRNDAPEGTDKDITILEDGSHTFTLADFGFTDPNDTPANDFLSVFIIALPIAGSLTLDGEPVTVGQEIAVADIAEGLLVFTPAPNGNSAPGSFYAKVEFKVRDDGGTANGGVDTDASPNTITFHVTPVNDPPVTTPILRTVSEDLLSFNVTLTDNITDVDLSAVFSVVPTSIPSTVTTAGGRVLVRDDQNNPFDFGNYVVFTNVPEDFPYAAFQLTLTGFGKFQDLGAGESDVFTLNYQITDGFAVVDHVVIITIEGVNDAPVAENDANTTDSVTPLVVSAAAGVLANDFDVDRNDTLVVTRFTIDGFTETFGPGELVVIGGVGSFVLNADGSYTFTPVETFTGNVPTITYTVSDNHDVSDTGTLSITVTPDGNDAPINTVPGAQTVAEDGTLVFSTANGNAITIFDEDSGASNVTVTLSVLHGTLTIDPSRAIDFYYAGGLITGNGTSSVTLTGPLSGVSFPMNAALEGLIYTPNSNYAGTDTLTVTTDDLGHTGSGGPLTDTDTITINVTSVNDAPAGTDKTVTIDEDTSYTFSAADFGFTDPNDSPANALQSVIITSLPTAGTLTLGGAAVTAGQAIAAAQLGTLVFTPAANASGTAYATFTFQVRDDGGTANGGADTDASPNTITIDVTPVPDAPQFTSRFLSQGARGLIAEGISEQYASGQAPFQPAEFTDRAHYQLTAPTPQVAGAVWGAIDLTRDFGMFVEINLGTDPGGADGIAFVLQAFGKTPLTSLETADPGPYRAGGTHGVGDVAGIPGSGIPNAFGFWTDTWQNIFPEQPDDTEVGDNSISFFQNTAGGVTTLPAGATATAIANPLENGQWHSLRVTWNAATDTLTYVLDVRDSSGAIVETLTASQTFDPAVFGTDQVYFGFVATTGSAFNRHMIRIVGGIEQGEAIAADGSASTIVFTEGQDAAGPPLFGRLSADGYLNFTDPDAGETYTVAVTNVAIVESGVVLTPSQRTEIEQALTVQNPFPTAPNSAYYNFNLAQPSYLPDGSVVTVTYTVTVTGSDGLTDTTDIVIRINGTNANPVLDLNGLATSAVGWLEADASNVRIADHRDASRVSAAGPVVDGPGIQLVNTAVSGTNSYEIQGGINATTLDGARTAGDYVTYTFTTAPGLWADGFNPAALTAIRFSQPFNNGDGDSYRIGVSISTDGFVTNETVIVADFLNDATTGGGDRLVWASPYALAPNTTYSVRVYFFDAGPVTGGEFYFWDNFRIDITDLSRDAGALYFAGSAGVAITGQPLFLTQPPPGGLEAEDTLIGDADSTQISKAVIQIANNYATGDELYVDTGLLPSGITAVWDPGPATLTLSGVASLADYETALELVRYHNTLPSPASGQRVINVTLFDAEGAKSNTAVSLIDVVGSNSFAVADTGTAFSDAHNPTTVVSQTASGNVLTNDTGAVAVTSVKDALGNAIATVAGGPITVGGIYGTLRINQDGSYTYIQHDSQTLTRLSQALASHGDATRATLTTNRLAFDTQPLRDVFEYAARDGSGNVATATLTIEVTPSLRSVIANDDAASLPATRAVGLTGNVVANDVLIEPSDQGPRILSISRADVTGGVLFDSFTSGGLSYVLQLTGRYGTLFMTPTGGYEYRLDTANPLVAALQPGQTLTETFDYTVQYGAGDDVGRLTFTITGTSAVNDDFSFTEAAGGVTPPTSGNILTNDGGLTNVSRIANNFTTVDVDADGESIAGFWGTLTIRSDGSFIYVPNEALVSSLVDGAVTTDTFTYTADAGGASSQALLRFIITGSNDPLVATPQTWLPVHFGGLPTVVQQAPGQNGFLLNAGNDPDSAFKDVVNGSVPTSLSVPNPFGPGAFLIGLSHEPFSDSLTVTSITPTSGAAALTFGQELNVTVPFLITSPGSPDTSTSVSFKIIGNAPPVGVDDVATVVEAGVAGAGVPTASGNVLANDTDANSGSGDTKTVTAVNGVPGLVGADILLTFFGPEGGFGTSTVRINADGTYTVTLDNVSMNFLRQTQTATATIFYTVTDSLGATSAANLLIRIEGANDAPVTVDDVFHVGALNPGLPLYPPIQFIAPVGVSMNDSDADRGDGIQSLVFEHFGTGNFVSADASFRELVGTYGTLFVTITGDYYYEIDGGHPDVTGLLAGQTLTDTFGYTRTDLNGASDSATLAIKIHGAVTTLAPQPDAGVAREAGGAFNGTAGSEATGNVLANDGGSGTRVVAILADEDLLDGDYQRAFNTVPDGFKVATAVSGRYGTLFVDAQGRYRYVVDDHHRDVEALTSDPDSALTETFYYVAKDEFGQRQLSVLNIMIRGQDDAPRVTPVTFAIEREGINDPLLVSDTGIRLLNFGQDPEGQPLSVDPGTISVTVGGLATAAGTTLPAGFVIDYTYDPINDALRIPQQQFEFLQKAFAGVDSFGNASGTPDVLTVYIDYLVKDSSGNSTPNRITLQIQGDSDYVSTAGIADTVGTTVGVVDFDHANMAFNRTFVYTVDNDEFASIAQDILINFDNTENRIDISDLIRDSISSGTLNQFIRAGYDSIADEVKIFVDPDGDSSGYDEIQIGSIKGNSTFGSETGPLGVGDTIAVVFDQSQPAERIVIG